MSFQVKKFNSLIASMINWMSGATTRVTDYNKGSVVRTILEAVAMEMEELYYQLLQATQEAIEEAIYRTFSFPRNPPEKATGTVRFTRLTGTEVIVSIPSGTLIATNTSPPILYETQANDTIPFVTGTATGGGLVLTLEAGGYVNAIAGDIGKTVQDDGASIGTLVAYDNATRQWTINTTAVAIVATSAMTIVTGTGAGVASSTLVGYLLDTGKNFVTEGIIAGSTVKDLTGSGGGIGEAFVNVVAATQLTFTGVLTNAATFYGGGHSYEVIVPYKDVSVRATEAGTDSNVDALALSVLRTNVANVLSVSNTGAITNGIDEETDMERKARFSVYIQSLARATRGALEYAAKTVETVVAAKAIDDVRATVFVYNYSAASPYTDVTVEMRNPADSGVLLFPDPQGQLDGLMIGSDEIFVYANIHLLTDGVITAGTLPIWQYWSSDIGGGTPGWKVLPLVTDGTDLASDGKPLTRSGTVKWDTTTMTDWIAATFNSQLKLWIRLYLPAGASWYDTIPIGDYIALPPGFGYVDLYCHDGSGNCSASLETSVQNVVDLYRGCGIVVDVKAPTKTTPTITFQLTIAANYDGDAIADETKQAVVDYINKKALGDDLYIAELYQLIMDSNDQAIVNVDITVPATDLIIPSSAVLRADPAYITVTYVTES